MSDDLARRVRAARPSAVATAEGRDRALAASRAALADGTRGASARRTWRLALAVAGLAAAAAAAAIAVVLVLAGGADEAPRIILPGDGEAPALAAPPSGTDVRVPELVGRGLRETHRLLGDLGLEAVTVAEGPGGLDAPIVLRQEPVAGTIVARGTTVTATMGPDPARPAAPQIDLPLLRPRLGPGPLRGDRLRVADLRGSVVVLAFTASWCEQCGTLSDTLQHADTGYGPRGAVLVAVGSRDPEDRARALVVPGTAYAVAHDPDGAAGDALGAVAFPEIVVIDRQGRIAARLRGETSAAELEAVLDPLVG